MDQQGFSLPGFLLAQFCQFHKFLAGKIQPFVHGSFLIDLLIGGSNNLSLFIGKKWDIMCAWDMSLPELGRGTDINHGMCFCQGKEMLYLYYFSHTLFPTA